MGTLQVAGGAADVRRGEGEEGADGGVQSGGEKLNQHFCDGAISLFKVKGKRAVW